MKIISLVIMAVLIFSVQSNAQYERPGSIPVIGVAFVFNGPKDLTSKTVLMRDVVDGKPIMRITGKVAKIDRDSAIPESLATVTLDSKPKASITILIIQKNRNSYTTDGCKARIEGGALIAQPKDGGKEFTLLKPGDVVDYVGAITQSNEMLIVVESAKL